MNGIAGILMSFVDMVIGQTINNFKSNGLLGINLRRPMPSAVSPTYCGGPVEAGGETAHEYTVCARGNLRGAATQSVTSAAQGSGEGGRDGASHGTLYAYTHVTQSADLVSSLPAYQLYSAYLLIKSLPLDK